MFFILNRNLIITSIIFVLLLSCDRNETSEIEINIISIKTEIRSEPGSPEMTKFGIIYYTAKNIGTKNINGWKVFFNIHVDHGPQLTAHESIYYTLEPNEESKICTLECIIPDYYEDAYKATLRHVDTW